jgi:hypothetical protein
MFRRKNPGRPGWFLLLCAALLLLLLAGAQGYVSWAAQFQFIDAAKHTHLPSVLEALGLDTGAVIFALLGLAHARMGRNSPIERTMNLACAGGSLTMNLLGADLGSPRSVAVFVLPAVLYSACSDRLIATAGHVSGVPEKSMWRWVGVSALYGVRAVLALPSTFLGLRRKVLELAPLPEPGKAVPSGTGVPEIESAPVNVPGDERVPDEPRTPAPRKPIEDVLADAEREFAADLGTGTVPGIRAIRGALNVGQSRAEKVQAHLSGLVESVPAPELADPDATVQFRAITDAPGQPTAPRAYQDLPTHDMPRTPVAR